MMDVMAALKEKRRKAEAKLDRAIKSLENAKKELADVQAAERVMAGITGESVDESSPGPLSDRDRRMAKLLGVGEDEAQTPLDLHAAYVVATGEEISLDVFRTALWRLQKKEIQGENRNWSVKSSNGRYWRESATAGDEFDELIGHPMDE